MPSGAPYAKGSARMPVRPFRVETTGKRVSAWPRPSRPKCRRRPRSRPTIGYPRLNWPWRWPPSVAGRFKMAAFTLVGDPSSHSLAGSGMAVLEQVRRKNGRPPSRPERAVRVTDRRSRDQPCAGHPETRQSRCRPAAISGLAEAQTNRKPSTRVPHRARRLGRSERQAGAPIDQTCA